MKNVLFVGPYRQADGWGDAAKKYVRALRHSGCNLAARPVYLNGKSSSWQNTDEFKDLEESSYDNYDVVIQNCLPHQFRKYGGVKNVGLSYFETTIKGTPWPNCISLMDEMWVASVFEVDMLNRIITDVEIRDIPIPCDPEIYKKEYKSNLFKNHEHEFKFYFLGEMIERKGLESLLIAFHTEFRPQENVRLVLKINRLGINPQGLLNHANQWIAQLKKNLGIYDKLHKSEIIITEYLSSENLYALHNECQCFVMPSSGESFCMPAFDAMMFGSRPALNINSGMGEFLKDSKHSFGIESHIEPAISTDKPLPFLYNGKDFWYTCSPTSIREAMRKAYVSTESTKEEDKEYAIKHILPKYSYENVGRRIGRLL